MRKQIVIIAVIAFIAASGGYYAARMLSPRPAPLPPPIVAPAPADLVGRERPDFELEDLEGRTVTAAEFDGRILLLNFWASWCQPCVEEMPMLSVLQRDFAGQGLVAAGIAVDDPARAREFAAGLSLDYTLLFGLTEAALVARRYGNQSGMLPYSVLIDRSGVIRWTHLGALEREDVERRLQALH